MSTPAGQRPIRWRPMLVYVALAIVVIVAVNLVFAALGVGSRNWLAPLVGGAIVGALFGVVYPRLYDLLAEGRERQ